MHAILPNILLLYSEHLKPSIENKDSNKENSNGEQSSPIAKRRLSKDDIGILLLKYLFVMFDSRVNHNKLD